VVGEEAMRRRLKAEQHAAEAEARGRSDLSMGGREALSEIERDLGPPPPPAEMRGAARSSKGGGGRDLQGLPLPQRQPKTTPGPAPGGSSPEPARPPPGRAREAAAAAMGVAAGAGAVGAVGVHQAVKQKQTDRRDAYKRPKAGRGAELLLKQHAG
jgi:hypothetical protein